MLHVVRKYLQKTLQCVEFSFLYNDVTTDTFHHWVSSVNYIFGCILSMVPYLLKFHFFTSCVNSSFQSPVVNWINLKLKIKFLKCAFYYLLHIFQGYFSGVMLGMISYLDAFCCIHLNSLLDFCGNTLD